MEQQKMITDKKEQELTAVISANEKFTADHTNEEKLKEFKSLWSKACADATSTEQLEALMRHVPIDHVGDINSVSRKVLIDKWIELEEKELAQAQNIIDLYHAYEHAPPEGPYKEKALTELIHLVNEKEAKDLHNQSVIDPHLAEALEKKFPNLTSRNNQKSNLRENIGGDGLYDLDPLQMPFMSSENNIRMIKKVRQSLGL